MKVSLRKYLIFFGLAISLIFGVAVSIPEANADEQSPYSSQESQLNDKERRRAQQFLSAVQDILKDTSTQRTDAKKLPSEEDYLIVAPPWTETREDREIKIRRLLDSALEILTDVPVVKTQKRITARKQNISDLKDQIAKLEEKRLTAPTDALLPGILTDTVSSIDHDIQELKARIDGNLTDIRQAKNKIYKDLRQNGVKLDQAQLELMLDSVLGGDMVKIAAAFNTVKTVDAHLADLMAKNSDNVKISRQYFAMHSTLFAMLVHAQGLLIEKIDQVYLKKLENIVNDIEKTNYETRNLLRKGLRQDQKRTLQANLRSQEFARKVASYYRSYLMNQRDQLVKARKRTRKDLRIADNTYRTVEASFQLRALIDEAKSSFDAINALEAPGFDRLFENEKMRKEFERLTDELSPSS